ncbi:hypothetical protein IE4771_PB00214 (plasmid) [Rhizobium etli bv. mimosae str. IE4771]|uniref:Uncharacterized protein n=1 Tax=Rhizobium etli bv. mimosae str. IE4771 TaxID=1432050 RepID=A0A060I876_RHIET|nr:hypothetical protein IE4771_PB00214 [Rhizobium sp. IE4771]
MLAIFSDALDVLRDPELHHFSIGSGGVRLSPIFGTRLILLSSPASLSGGRHGDPSDAITTPSVGFVWSAT